MVGLFYLSIPNAMPSQRAVGEAQRPKTGFLPETKKLGSYDTM